jgi:hypothetical protein
MAVTIGANTRGSVPLNQSKTINPSNEPAQNPPSTKVLGSANNSDQSLTNAATSALYGLDGVMLGWAIGKSATVTRDYLKHKRIRAEELNKLLDSEPEFKNLRDNLKRYEVIDRQTREGKELSSDAKNFKDHIDKVLEKDSFLKEMFTKGIDTSDPEFEHLVNTLERYGKIERQIREGKELSLDDKNFKDRIDKVLNKDSYLKETFTNGIDKGPKNNVNVDSLGQFGKSAWDLLNKIPKYFKDIRFRGGAVE